jgi:hypothetical protein
LESETNEFIENLYSVVSEGNEPDVIDIEKAFRDLVTLKEDLASDCLDIDAMIKFAQARKDEIVAQYIDEIAALETRIKDEILKRGTSFKCNFGAATYKKAYERASWDDKKLQGFAIVHPEIMAARNVTTVVAYVSIKTTGAQ